MKLLSNTCVTAACCGPLLLFIGCQSLPWGGSRPDEPVVTAKQYVEQAAANHQYDAALDSDTDYIPLAPHSTSTAPSPDSASLPASGGSCCH